MNEINTNINNTDNQKLINFALFLILIISLVTLVSLYTSRGVRHYGPNAPVVVHTNVFENTSLVAKSAIVYDIKNKKVVYEKNADEPLALASVTKILTAVTALDRLEYSNVITIKKEFLLWEGDTGLRTDEVWSFKDLLDFSLVASSNDGTAAIAAAAGAVANREGDNSLDHATFIINMNEKAASIGMKTSKFYNETGLDLLDGTNGGYASARDLATLFEYTLRNHPEVFEATREQLLSVTSESNIAHKAQNTNSSVNAIPNLIGSKTGFTDIAGGNLGIIFDAGIDRPIAVIVLSSTYEGRFADIESLIQKTLESISQE